MTRLLLVRHGESTWNAERRWQGQADPPLSPRGEEEARTARAAARAQGPFDRIHCSPLQRARRTAELLHLGRPEPVPGLEERGAGAWTGLTHAEIDEGWPGARQGGWRPGDYEAEEALRDRAARALGGLEGTCLVVVHEGLLRALDGDPAPIPNLGARWFTAAIEPDGPRFPLTPPRRPSPHHPGSS